MKYLFRKPGKVFLASLLDFMGYGVVRSWRQNSRHRDKTPSTILLVRLDHLGDTLLSTGIPKILKEHLPAHRLIFLTSSLAAPLLDNNPFVDEVQIYDAPWFFKKTSQWAPVSPGFFNLVGRLKEKNIDLGIATRGDLRENLLMALAGAKERVGYGVTGGGFLLTREVHYHFGRHESQHSLDILKALDIRLETIAPQIYFSKDEEEMLESKWRSFLARCSGRRVGLLIEAGSEAKEWALKNKIEFLKSFQAEFPKDHLLLLGTDSKKVSELRSEVDLSFCENLVGKTTLRELIFLTRRLHAFVGADSGPTHLAASLGISTIFLYSGTNAYEEWKPLSESAQTLLNPVPCAPCGLRVCSVKGHPCMAGIKPGQVLDLLRKNLNGVNPSTPLRTSRKP